MNKLLRLVSWFVLLGHDSQCLFPCGNDSRSHSGFGSTAAPTQVSAANTPQPTNTTEAKPTATTGF